eukprot:1158567-Pelagomonas_calceolata.AAC.7
MGREPLGLPASGKVHTWLPWPAQGTPRLVILATLPNKTAWHLCSVSGAWEAVAGAVKSLLQYFGRQCLARASQLSILPETDSVQEQPRSSQGNPKLLVASGAVCKSAGQIVMFGS